MYFDVHSDIWTDVTAHRLKGETNVLHNRHYERLKKGGVEGSIFVIWVDPPHTENHDKRTHEIFSCVQSEISEVKDFRIVHNYEEMMKARADGIMYIFIGVEGMAYIGADLSKIDDYYNFGARHAMLTWNDSTALGHGSKTGRTDGLTEVGKKAVRIIQDKGMIFDVSHLNEAGFWDVMKLATAPIIASHSNCKALCDIHRNLTDDQLRAIRDLNGCVGLCALNALIHQDRAKATVQDLARHADHMIEVMGIDHVGLGFDFYEFLGADDPNAFSGKNTSTKGLDSSAEIPNLFRCFEELGMSKAEMDKIAHGNFHRIIRECVG